MKNSWMMRCEESSTSVMDVEDVSICAKVFQSYLTYIDESKTGELDSVKVKF